jgi:hypothetical protein
VIWGRWGLPVPYRLKILYAFGKPLKVCGYLSSSLTTHLLDTVPTVDKHRHYRHNCLKCLKILYAFGKPLKVGLVFYYQTLCPLSKSYGQ